MENNAVICRSISKKFGEKIVLKDFSFSFPYGEISVIGGASGCGKTTLLRIIASLEKADTGEVLTAPQSKISYLFQEDRLFPKLSVKKNVEAVIEDKQKKPLASEILCELGLKNELNRYPSELSGGMKRRVAIARALAYGGDILLLDEAFKGLDEQNAENAADIIKKYAKGKTIISVTHTPSTLEKNASVRLLLPALDTAHL